MLIMNSYYRRYFQLGRLLAFILLAPRHSVAATFRTFEYSALMISFIFYVSIHAEKVLHEKQEAGKCTAYCNISPASLFLYCQKKTGASD